MSRRAVCFCTGPEPAIYPHPADPTKKVCRECLQDIQMAMEQADRLRSKRVGDVGERRRMFERERS